jgi:hypothetical protein
MVLFSGNGKVNKLFAIIFVGSVLTALNTMADITLFNNLSGISLISERTYNEKDSTKADKSHLQKQLDRIDSQMENVIKKAPLPVVSYSSTTQWLFGLTKINAFRMGAKTQNDTCVQPSHITGLVYFTQEKQFKFVVTSNLMFAQNKYESFTQFMIINFPALYFGTGNNTKSEESCILDSRNINFLQSFKYNFNEKWYFGIKYNSNNYHKIDTLGNCDAVDIDLTNLPDNQGLQSGLGFSLSRDSRDNRFNAYKGSYIFVEYMAYADWFGSDFNYESIILDVRKYLKPLKWLIVAGQFYAVSKKGDVPIQSLALMGGDKRMRGIYLGRYRDKTMMEGQLELRFPLFWIVGGAVFGGIGEVAPDFFSYTIRGLKYTFGMGLRMMVNKDTRTNMRFDLGFHQNRAQFFFTFSESF